MVSAACAALPCARSPSALMCTCVLGSHRTRHNGRVVNVGRTGRVGHSDVGVHPLRPRRHGGRRTRRPRRPQLAPIRTHLAQLIPSSGCGPPRGPRAFRRGRRRLPRRRRRAAPTFHIPRPSGQPNHPVLHAADVQARLPLLPHGRTPLHTGQVFTAFRKEALSSIRRSRDSGDTRADWLKREPHPLEVQDAVTSTRTIGAGQQAPPRQGCRARGRGVDRALRGRRLR